MTPLVSRRTFLASIAVGAALPPSLLASKTARVGGPGPGDHRSGPDDERRARGALLPSNGRLAARPGALGKLTLAPGVHSVPSLDGREAQLLVPAAVADGAAASLAVMLHGAGGSIRGPLRFAGPAAEATGTLLLVPKSRDGTWDLLHDGFGPDVAFIDYCLAWAFGACNVDAKRLAIGGFSDGGSYALSLGVVNGDLFSHVLAFSPGFVGSAEPFGNPSVYISHGTADEVLPIDRASRRIVPGLRKRGYHVTYKEFDGPHTVPDEVALEALRWVSHGAG